MSKTFLLFGWTIVLSLTGACASAQTVPIQGMPPLQGNKTMPIPLAQPPGVPPFPPKFPDFFRFEVSPRSLITQPQLLLMSEMNPQMVTDWNEDLRVMSRLVRDAVARVSNGEGRQAMGIRIRTLESSPATYIEGFGVLLSAETAIPLAASGHATTKPADDVPADAWESARREISEATTPVESSSTGMVLSSLSALLAQKQSELNLLRQKKGSEQDIANLKQLTASIQTRINDLAQSMAAAGVTQSGSPPTSVFDAGKLQALKNALAETLTQATHFRHLATDNVVWLTVSGADDAGKPIHLNFRISKADLEQLSTNAITADEVQRRITNFVY